MFRQCCDLKILRSKREAELVIWFCIECIKQERPANRRHSHLHTNNISPLFSAATYIIGQTQTRELPGLMIALGGIIDSSNTDAKKYTKAYARSMLKLLLRSECKQPAEIDRTENGTTIR